LPILGFTTKIIHSSARFS